MRHLTILLCAIATACGSGVNHISNPTPQPGGGVGSGEVNGELNVFVIDSSTAQPISGATVIVHTKALAAPLTGTTSTTGLATFTSDSLSGAQDITATAGSYVTGSFLGANGAVVTMPLDPVSATAPTVDTATLEGTITGFCPTIPNPPPVGHATLALVRYSNVLPVGDPANNIAQGGGPIPANSCYNSLLGCSCDFMLTTRTGPQMIYAIIGDYDTTAQTLTVSGYAFLANQNFTKGQNVTGLTLTPVDSSHVKTLPIAFSNVPAGLDAMNGIVGVDLGDQGLIGGDLITSSTVTSVHVPTLTDDLSSGKYVAFLNAQDSATLAIPSSALLTDPLDTSGTVTFSNWLGLPENIAGATGARTFAFSAIAGAKFVGVAVTDGSGNAVWNNLILDGRTSFTFPAIAGSDPLALTGLEGTVTGIDGPFDPKSFNVDDAKKTASRISTNQAAFTQ
jgi:hypothetical protein